MKPLTLGRALFALATLITFGSLFSPVSAATVSIINNWQDPAPYSFYSFNSEVHVTGSYTLPPDWVGTIYIWQDGIQLPQTLTVDNLGNVAAKTAAFDINLGLQPALPSPHDISIEFFGGTSCFILNKCPGTSSNWTDESIVPRTYTASNTPDPVLAISYDANGTMPLQSPAFDFANVPVNTTDTRTLYVRNVGGGVAVGAATIAGGANPFYCVGTCTYSIPAGPVGIPIQVQYAPTSVGMVSTGVLAFGCTSFNCAGVNANLQGTSIASAIPPEVDLSESYLGFGYVNVGEFAEQTITVTNSGGGILSGALTLGDTANYSCVPSCSYNLASSDSITITVRFRPLTGGGFDTTATFTGGVTPEAIDIYGSGNDQPIIDINCVGCSGVGNGGQYWWDIPTPVAPGQTIYQSIEIYNTGVGTMNGAIINTPGWWNTLGWHCTSVTQGGVTTPYTDATPCAYTNLVNGGAPAIAQFEFVGSVANIGPQSSYVTFQEDNGDTADLALDATVTTDPMLQIGGLGSDLGFMDTLINTPTPANITLTNIGTTPLTVVINLPIGAGVFTCDNPLQCNAPIIIAAGDTVDVAFSFTPTLPQRYDQPFTICVGTACGNYYMHGLGQDPHLKVMSAIPGGENMDLYSICAREGNTCTFTGTKTVYFGLNTNFISKSFTGSAACNTSAFGGDPVPSTSKKCWIANTDGGTWTNRPWATQNRLVLYNDGTGGTVEYRMVSPTNFICDNVHPSAANLCEGDLSNADESDFTSYYDIDQRIFFFNPSIPGPVSQTMTIQYHYIAWQGYTAPDCNYCHTMTINLSGTGLSGPHLSYTMGAFPLTNINATSTANLVVRNDGTSADLGVSVNRIGGEFSCTANCGPYDINPGGSFTAEISFHPLAAGVRSGSFSLDATPLGTPPSVTVPVSGTGNASPIVTILNPVGGSLDYGPVNQGSQRVSGDWGPLSSIIVTNTGAGLLTGDATIVGGTHYKCIVCHYEALAPGATQEIKISFIPKNVGQLNDVVNFSGGGNGLLPFNVYGFGQLGASSVNSPDTSFGRVVIRPGNFKEQIVKVYNNGGVDVPGGDITMTGPFSCTHPPTPFNAVTGKCSYPVIPAGGYIEFTIRFTPVAPGPANGIISLGGSSNARIRLSGTGVVPSVKFQER